MPNLGSLAREIGGDQVAVTIFAKGTEDFHSIEAKPSFIKTLSEADLFVEMGMEMETGVGPGSATKRPQRQGLARRARLPRCLYSDCAPGAP